ncbi:MAG: polymer-forming cytoskeletal protein [Hydrogenophaga sp.]|jgi:cytoskeletal protein CcmA (bactofilin family)|uniref:bactofilin family protein n=1 Tax=Hydrogenophaga sp. TaxID=1904254 RepID=UPI00260C90C5|nr:polymer-forming cytoskeletal protein [Hydrogenophaga sp.]MCV0441348.1 polymer-forming cytoskeletal protein [Hydrogenophaga sp.]
MFAKKKQPPIKSLIAQGTRVEGNVLFHDGLRIDGEVVGDIRASDEQASILVVSEVAVVTGQIHADHVIINGQVKGPVLAFELLELQPKARIEGDVSYKALEMHQGATISGQLKPMAGGVEDKPTLKLAANNS